MSITRRATSLAALGLIAAPVIGPHAAKAQEPPYPSRPITLIVPFGPGGGTDILARLLAQQLAPALGQPILVDNRAGATGTIGMAQLSRARPDGYTLAIAPNGTFAMAPPLFPRLPYDNDRAFAPIGLLATSPMFLCVHPASPWTTLAELLAAARAEPGRLTYASAGPGATNHLGMELLMEMAGIRLLHVPYRSAAQSAQAVMTREVAVSLVDASVAMPFIRSQELRPLAASGSERSSQLPQLPTFAESGLPGYRSSVDLGLFAPAGTPQAILDRLSERARTIIGSVEMNERLLTLAMEPVAGRPDEFAAYQASETAKWADLIRRRDIRLE